MLLKSLLHHIDVKSVVGPLDIEINKIAYDSRLVAAGDLFVAVKGFKSDGHAYIAAAAANGAAAVLLEETSCITKNSNITWIQTSDSRRALALVSAAFYNNPSENLRVLGITGTNGKTTSTFLLEQIMELQHKKSGVIGTISIRIGDKVIPSANTTPESLDLQRYLAAMVQEKMDYAVMEVSSHALALERCLPVEFDTAIFTNLTQDHLDFHKDMEDYFQAKLKLFKQLTLKATKCLPKNAVINIDDPHGQRIAAVMNEYPQQVRVITYAVKQPALVRAEDICIKSEGVSFKVSVGAESQQFNLHLTGMFNVYNCLGAIAAGWAEGISLQELKTALEAVRNIPGRFEKVSCGQKYTVIVDYAHTPDGLDNILRAAREFVQGRIITVFGCGGDRDKTKRPRMGKIAARYSDLLYVTSDNPRSEDPEQILADIAVGLKEAEAAGIITADRYIMESDRRTAIGLAIERAVPGDVVIIAGKGHENYQILADRTIDFDDRQIAEHFIREREKRTYVENNGTNNK